MKQILFLSLVMITFVATACPQFKSKYKCAYENGSRDLTLYTRIEDGNFIYKYNEAFDIIADGAERSFSTDQTIWATCSSQTLKVNLLRQNPSGFICPDGPAKSLVTTTYWTKDGNKIQEHNSGIVTCADGSTMPIGTGDYVCTEQ